MNDPAHSPDEQNADDAAQKAKKAGNGYEVAYRQVCEGHSPNLATSF
jgi:hypothetical protein